MGSKFGLKYVMYQVSAQCMHVHAVQRERKSSTTIVMICQLTGRTMQKFASSVQLCDSEEEP